MHRSAKTRFFLKFLRNYYYYIFSYDFIFGYAIYTAYLHIQGLSPSEIGAIFAFWSLSVILFELPSGILSDRYDRRVLLIVSPLIKSVCFVVWIFADGEAWLYGLAFLFWSAGSALCSGTKEALLYEHIHAVKLGRAYEKLLGRERAFTAAGVMLGSAVGGFIGHYSMELALWLSIPPLVTASFAARHLTDIRRTHPQTPIGDGIPYRQTLGNALLEFKNHADIRFITIFLALGITTLGALEEFDQLFYQVVSLPVWAYGLMIAGVNLIGVIASANAYRLAGIRSLSWLFPALSGLFLIASGFAQDQISLIPLMLAYAVIAPLQVLADAKFQKTMEGKSRATTTSTLNLFIEIAGIAFMLILGFLIEIFDVLAAYQLTGIYLCIFALWVYWRFQKGFSITFKIEK